MTRGSPATCSSTPTAARFAVLASHADENLTLKPVLPGGERLADLDDELTVDTVTLGPFEIKILKFAEG